DRSGRLRLVGSAGAGRGMAGDALATARKCSLARPQYGRGARGRTSCRLCLPPGRGSTCRQRTAAVWTGGLDNRAVQEPQATTLRAAMASDAAARKAGDLEFATRASSKRAGVRI